MKRNDWKLMGLILGIAVLFIIGRFVMGQENGSYMRISVDGTEFGTYLLSQDQEITIYETNVCRIQDGKVYMVSAKCPDQVCVHHEPISNTGESIICLPNRVVLEVKGSEDGQLDSISE